MVLRLLLVISFVGLFSSSKAQVQNYYGVNSSGGPDNYGSIYTGKTDGSQFSVLHMFTTTTDGYYPAGFLAWGQDSSLYGTCQRGGYYNYGTIFKISPQGTFSKVWDFQGTPYGGKSQGGLISGKDGNLYGICPGGTSAGIVFRISTGGVFTKISDFYGPDAVGFFGALVEDDADTNVFYGVSIVGGIYGNGSAFQIKVLGNGASFTKIFDFNSSVTGGYLYGSLIIGTDGQLYGLCNEGGDYGSGTAFKMSKMGQNFTKLIDFDYPHAYLYGPYGSFLQASNGLLYGALVNGGNYSDGFIFSFDPKSYNYSIVRNLNPPNDGANLMGGSMVQAANGNIYGLTDGAGTYSAGTIYQITPNNVFSTIHNFDLTTEGNDTDFNSLILSKLTQTILGFSFSSDTIKGTHSLNLSNVTATSGLPVTFTSSNLSVASVSGSTIVILNAGVTTITAFQVGNTNYYPASPIAQKVVISSIAAGITEFLPVIQTRIYPNPSNGQFTIYTSEPLLLEIFDSYGRKVSETQVSGEQSIFVQDKGVYNARFSDAYSVKTQKLVVE